MKAPRLSKALWVAIAMAAAAAGLGMLLLTHAYEPASVVRNAVGEIVGVAPRTSFWVIVEHLASALLILSIWHVVEHWYLRKQVQTELLEHIRTVYGETALVKDARTIGITALYQNSYAFSWESVVKDSENLTLVFGSGREWVLRYAEALTLRFRDSSKRTEIFLVHPESPMAGAVATKLGYSAAKYIEKIKETLEELQRMGVTTGNAGVYGHFSTDSHFLCVSDNQGFLTPRYFATRSRHAPIFQFEGGREDGFMLRVLADIENLKSLSRPLLQA